VLTYNFFATGYISIIGFYRIINYDQACYENVDLILINMFIITFLGFMNGLMIFMTLFLVVVCSPCIIVYCIRYCRDQRTKKNEATELVRHILKFKFKDQIFNENKSCVICLEDFKEDSEVTPLPCDMRHYFHTECI
jgi:hypothetical protein